MYNLYHTILDWSEVWALLIPVTVLLIYKNKTAYLKPVRIYLWITLFINILIDIISNLKGELGIQPDNFLWNNNFLYNLGSVARLIFYAWFFISLPQRFIPRTKKILPVIFLLFILVDFTFFETFIPQGDDESFSSWLLALEAAILLFYCLQYFIYLIVEDKTVKLGSQPGFWLVVGLSIYVATNFFIFLFYATLSDESSKEKRNFAVHIWDVHNIVFILMCIFMAIQFTKKHV